MTLRAALFLTLGLSIVTCVPPLRAETKPPKLKYIKKNFPGLTVYYSDKEIGFENGDTVRRLTWQYNNFRHMLNVNTGEYLGFADCAYLQIKHHCTGPEEVLEISFWEGFYDKIKASNDPEISSLIDKLKLDRNRIPSNHRVEFVLDTPFILWTDDGIRTFFNGKDGSIHAYTYTLEGMEDVTTPLIKKAFMDALQRDKTGNPKIAAALELLKKSN